MEEKKYLRDNAHLMTEWNSEKNRDLNPNALTCANRTKVWWKCLKGHEYLSRIDHRVSGSGCPYCAGKRAIKGETDLATLCPDLIEEWHPVKNGELRPEDCTRSSGRKVWWIDKHGHEWEASISNRSKGNGCPICGRIKARDTRYEKLLKDRGSFGDKHSELLAEWDYERNIGVNPYEIAGKSSRKVWWKCEKGHKWETAIYKRANGEGCPYCSNKRILAGFNDLESQNPDLAKEWHLNKNAPLLPTMVTANSHKKVWWVCKSGHEWEAVISNRNRLGRGCPQCAQLNRGKGVRKGYLNKRGSFAVHFPEVASEWNYEKNGKLTPNDMTRSSGQIVWWKCKKCAHEWKASISNRSKGSGCAICGKIKAKENRYERLLQNRGSFGDKYKDLLSEWDYEKNTDYTPYEITVNSNKKVWWRCSKCGHEWKAVIHGRTKGGGCPRCIKERQTSFPEKCIFFYIKQVFEDAQENQKFNFIGKMEIDIFIPSLNVGIEYDGHYWHKNIAKDRRKDQLCHENGITLIRIREPNCPMPTEHLVNTYYYHLDDLSEQELEESIKHIIQWIVLHKHIRVASIAISIEADRTAIYECIDMYEKTNSLQLKYPELSEEWHLTKNGVLKPSYFKCGSDKKVWWQCELGHEWKAVISSRVLGSGCPICAGQSVLKGYNDLSATHPLLITEWNYDRNINILPDSISAGSREKVWWKCKLGHEWKAVVSSRVAGSGCSICSGHSVLSGYNDLSTKNPALAAEWNYNKNRMLTPEMVSIGSSKKVWWQCELSHEWQASIWSRSKGNGCPVCANKRVEIGFNDLAFKCPDIAKEWHPTKNINLKSTDVVYSSSKKVWWKSSCGHEWDAKISDRYHKGNGCPYCASKRVLAGYNDLASQNKVLTEEWDYDNNTLEPSKVTPNSHKKVWWKCKKCRHHWQAIIKNRNKGQGCPRCAKEKR
ncbi:zinc-ribbon domain-containing protein [Priestia sp. P5]|uniref:zinc-ribbon domain-containing protein n=1 Tax=Priestia sp. P5 TaxID=2917806 RepID=UPI002406ACEE|nr:zinc-ribbon domain-containing protein [Priestia sp. P5]MDG0059150.1 zinc-ribbon domain-containing protein [Priestia sp. P5]